MWRPPVDPDILLEALKAPRTLDQIRWKAEVLSRVASLLGEPTVPAATFYATLAADLAACASRPLPPADEWVSLDDAVRLTGYGKRRLVALAKSGLVRSRGSHRNRTLLSGSLPVKPGHVPEAMSVQLPPAPLTSAGGPVVASALRDHVAVQARAAALAGRSDHVSQELVVPPVGSPYDPVADARSLARLRPPKGGRS